MDLAAGMYVTPNVCLIRQVGEGGMGSVSLAEHQALHTHVAVKFVSAELAKTEPLILCHQNFVGSGSHDKIENTLVCTGHDNATKMTTQLSPEGQRGGKWESRETRW